MIPLFDLVLNSTYYPVVFFFFLGNRSVNNQQRPAKKLRKLKRGILKRGEGRRGSEQVK